MKVGCQIFRTTKVQQFIHNPTLHPDITMLQIDRKLFPTSSPCLLVKEASILENGEKISFIILPGHVAGQKKTVPHYSKLPTPICPGPWCWLQSLAQHMLYSVGNTFLKLDFQHRHRFRWPWWTGEGWHFGRFSGLVCHWHHFAQSKKNKTCEERDLRSASYLAWDNQVKCVSHTPEIKTAPLPHP